jgi:hypothetical protein
MPAPKRKEASARSRKKEGSNPWIPFILVVVLGSLMASAYWLAEKNRAPTDPQTLCRTDQPPPVVAVVLVDVTDQLTELERNQVVEEVERLRSTLPRFALIEVYAMGRGRDDMRAPRVSICNPGAGEDMSSLYQNPVLAKARWLKDFKPRLDEAVDSVVTESKGDQSLLMEAIRTASVNTFGRPEFDSAEKQIYVFSDFLQHVPGVYSQYEPAIGDYSSFRESTYGSSVRANLQGVTVKMFYIERSRTKSFQGRSHVEFWIAHFERSGASVMGVKKILGD